MNISTFKRIIFCLSGAAHRFLFIFCFLPAVFLLLFSITFSPFSISHAGDEPFDTPANWGSTGLMETPTARVLREGRFRVGISQIDPYRYYYGAISPLKGLEIDGRITEILDLPVSPGSASWEGYGNYKDKAVGLKYQMLPETKYLPAVAVGFMDPHGTRLYPSQYVVLSKQIYPFDFSIGLGNGRFGKKPLPSQGEGFKLEMLSDTNTWFSDSQLFGGIQFAPSEKYMFMAEYSPISYHLQTQDPAQKKYFQKAVPSQFNFGFRWRPYRFTCIDVTYQRGNQVGVNLSFAFDMGNPLVPLYDPPYRERPERRLSPLEERIALAFFESGFRNIGVSQIGDDIWIEAENDKYYYQTRAIGVSLQIINDIAPSPVGQAHIILTRGGIPLVDFTAARGDIALFRQEALSLKEFINLSEIKTDRIETLSVQKRHEKFLDYGIKPEIRTFLNDPSGFLKYRIGVSGWLGYRPWRGGSFVVGPEFYPVNTVSTVNQPLSKPVRSDIVPYQQDNVALGRLLFEQIEKFRHEIYGRIAAGILEIQYAGLDGELATHLFGGRLMVGISGSLVKKREAGSPLKLKENDYKDYYTTAFVNTRLNIPHLEAAIDLRSGQFLAGDIGTRITLSKFFNGVILSVWYSFTDTSIFTDAFNKNYHDKGIAITIPLRHFKGTDTRTAYSFAVSPWTRDVAQDIDHYNTLFDFMGRNVGIYLGKDRGYMK